MKKYLRVRLHRRRGLGAEQRVGRRHLRCVFVARRGRAATASRQCRPAARRCSTIDHIAAEVDILLPTSGSCGQLLVYERLGFARTVGRRGPGGPEEERGERLAVRLSGNVPSVIAYWPRRIGKRGFRAEQVVEVTARPRGWPCARSSLTVTTPVDSS